MCMCVCVTVLKCHDEALLHRTVSESRIVYDHNDKKISAPLWQTKENMTSQHLEMYKNTSNKTITRKRAIAKALQLKGHSDFAPVDPAYYHPVSYTHLTLPTKRIV